ncbi:MAG: alpha/beta hydrolase [Gammaproteobacteria bacterium]|nr:alpha/beta hydrolase [Gammaproteobacteria bacterium]
MAAHLPTGKEWARRCAADGEFRLAARYWNGGLVLRIGEDRLALTLTDGVPAAGEPGGEGVLEYAGPGSVWAEVLAAAPPRFHNDLMANIMLDLGITRHGDAVLHAQYYGAVMRAVELLRPAADAVAIADGPVAKAVHDAPLGRYLHLTLDDADHRIYYEEAGQGIPLLLQHTAGCHGSQWRHLFEVPEITDHFRLIAYDLPYHGKSLPPTNVPWWSAPYALRGKFLRSVPLALADALELDRPVFMGCSVGGLLALDLALRHPKRFRAVLAVEGALKVDGDLDALTELWHPQVSNEYKARLMEGLMAPASPLAYRKETSFVYACGWPPAFLGDLYYYLEEFDLREVAADIDTAQVAVHILSGEYDYSGRVELGQAAHEAIVGSTFTAMSGVGHFPMSENPRQFISHVLPLLESIREGA